MLCCIFIICSSPDVDFIGCRGWLSEGGHTQIALALDLMALVFGERSKLDAWDVTPWLMRLACSAAVEKHFWMVPPWVLERVLEACWEE